MPADYPTRYGMWLDHRPANHTPSAIDDWADEIASWGLSYGSIDLNTGTKPLHVPNYDRDALARVDRGEPPAPLEPTSAPVTIKRSFSSMKPVADAAQPE